MGFGLSYQGIQVTSLLKDSITPVLIGTLLGTADVGYVTWAGIVATYPVLALFVLQRLYMPAFSRLQEHREQLTALAENVIWATNVVTAPLAVLTLALIVPITVSVYGPKWLVALPYFYLLWPANVIVTSATPAMGLLNALGKSNIVLTFAVIWMAGTWIVGAPLIWLYGPIGFPIAALVVQISAYWLFRAAQREVPFRLASVVLPVWLIAGACGVAVYAGLPIADATSYSVRHSLRRNGLAPLWWWLVSSLQDQAAVCVGLAQGSRVRQRPAETGNDSSSFARDCNWSRSRFPQSRESSHHVQAGIQTIHSCAAAARN